MTDPFRDLTVFGNGLYGSNVITKEQWSRLSELIYAAQTAASPVEVVRRDHIAIDATCPKCGHPERRANFDEHGAVFSCRQCPYVSRERDA